MSSYEKAGVPLTSMRNELVRIRDEAARITSSLQNLLSSLRQAEASAVLAKGQPGQSAADSAVRPVEAMNDPTPSPGPARPEFGPYTRS